MFSLISSGSPVSSTCLVKPAVKGTGSGRRRSPRSSRYGKLTVPVASSRIAIAVPWASKISWILSPTTS
jgi:hypothetical protein